MAGHKMLIFLFVKYEEKRSLGWLTRRRFKGVNRRISSFLGKREEVSSRPDTGTCVVLPELDGVSRREAESWARSAGERRLSELLPVKPATVASLRALMRAIQGVAVHSAEETATLCPFPEELQAHPRRWLDRSAPIRTWSKRFWLRSDGTSERRAFVG